MVLVGGYTRLTLAGLSMTDWTFRGSPMPSSEEAWTQQFDKYKMTPEYRKVHYGISLDEFKNIYFTEWFHRMFGRLTGVAFAGGLAYFGIRGILRLPMLLRTSACLAIGGFQGLVGWYMVKSGLNEPKDEHAVPRVSPYRLVFHLATAVALYTALLWNAMTLLRSRNLSTAINANIQNCGVSLADATLKGLRKARGLGTVVLGVVGCTLVSGGFVAGNDAGRAFNTWPKMLDRWVPQEVTGIKTWKDVFENVAVVQFDHRMLAYMSVASSAALFAYTRRIPGLPPAIKFAAHLMPAVATIQMVLGIGTLTMHVPPYMGVIHQGGGILAWTSVLYFLHSIVIELTRQGLRRARI
eukprot:GHVQ01001937.1.p1 GENE.GHVQ01001937.1~~GHVQ01001937.1.p1  ORF type:complete len:353 (+),score=14.08 GHVQ01001937.1:1673-2731(+)